MRGGLWVVLPVYNEESCVESVIREWLPVLSDTCGTFVMLALNDGSTDSTLSVLRRLEAEHPELRVVDKGNTGHGQSCVQGYRMALEAGADWVFQIDSDGQCDPRFFEAFWGARNPGGVRYGFRRTRDDGRFRYYASRLVSVATLLACGVWVRDANVPYRLMHASGLEGIAEAIPPDFHLANILVAVLQEQKCGIQWIDIHFRERIGGAPSAKPSSFARHGVKLFRQLREYFRERPAAPASPTVP
jgi:glycosyltransferase involved in cell wall biosynthesis